MILVIDGVDGVGKETQSKLLTERLNKEGYNAKRISFPDYDDKNCNLVKAYLNEEVTVSLALKHALYATERAVRMKQKDIVEFLEDENNILVCDRYVSSSMIYDTKSFCYKKMQEALSEIESIEYDKYETPREDMTIVLSLSKEYIMHELSKRETTDKHESDSVFMRDVISNVGRVSSELGYETVICDTEKEEGLLSRLTIEEVSDEVMKLVRPLLNNIKK